MACRPCPGCLGEGHLDFRDDDALYGERFSDAELAYLRAERNLQHPLGIIRCSECEGTGIVTDARWRELNAAAVAAVDQALAAYHAQEARP